MVRSFFSLVLCPRLTLKIFDVFFCRLGRDAIGVFLGDGDNSQIKQFANSRRHQVLIIGYEKVCPPLSHFSLRT